MNSNAGFTLVEVLVSIIILALIVTGFFQFFIFSQKMTVSNQGNLVGINIAQSVLEQVKEKSYPEVTVPSAVYPKTFDAASTCTSSDQTVKDMCLKRYQKTVNNKNFSIEIIVGTEIGHNLHSVKVKVYGKDRRLKSTVKGMIEI